MTEEIPAEKRKIGPIVWASLIAPVAIVIFLMAYEIVSPIRLSVSNQSEHPLTQVVVEVQDHRLVIPDLQPGESHSLWFRNRHETSPYTLTARLPGDREIEKTDGELRSGMLNGFYGPVLFAIGTDGEITFSEN